MNNATCVAKYGDGDYQCACAPGFIGERCETGILTYQFAVLDFIVFYYIPCLVSSREPCMTSSMAHFD